MLGPNTADEFGRFGAYNPPAMRSEIDDFTVADALSVLDGDVKPEESARIAAEVRDAMRRGVSLPKRPHGGHRYGTGWGKTEFESGWGENEVIDFVCGIIDNPTRVAQRAKGFSLHGTYKGFPGVVVVNRVGGGVPGWYVSTVYPERVP